MAQLDHVCVGLAVVDELREITGWTIVAENKPGGGGIAMFTGLANQPADGSVIGLGVSMPVLINLVLRPEKLNFTLDSFDYLASVARAQLGIIAKSDAPFDDIAGLVDYARANGGAAVGFDAKPQELILQIIEKATGAGIRPVSSESSAEVIKLVLGEQVIAGFSAGTHIPYLDSGELKQIASANAGRHNYAPDVQTVREQGYDVYVDPWFYFAAPAGLPDVARDAIAGALAEALAAPGVQEAVVRILSAEVDNLGVDGTKSMMVDGIDNVKRLFAN